MTTTPPRLRCRATLRQQRARRRGVALMYLLVFLVVTGGVLTAMTSRTQRSVQSVRLLEAELQAELLAESIEISGRGSDAITTPITLDLPSGAAVVSGMRVEIQSASGRAVARRSVGERSDPAGSPPPANSSDSSSRSEGPS